MLVDLYGICTVFGFLGTVFYDRPNRQFIERLSQEKSLLFEPPFSTTAPDGAALLSRALSEIAENTEVACSALNQDYAFLFTLSGNGKTSPYESVYLSDDHTLAGPEALAVRKAFEHGFFFGCPAHEPADHFGLECAFIAHLAARAIEYEETELPAETECVISQVCHMVENHILVFSSTYLKNIQKHAKTNYYRACAHLAEETLDSAVKHLGIR